MPFYRFYQKTDSHFFEKFKFYDHELAEDNKMYLWYDWVGDSIINNPEGGVEEVKALPRKAYEELYKDLVRQHTHIQKELLELQLMNIK